MSYRMEVFCARKEEGCVVTPAWKQTQLTPAGRRGGAVPTAGWRFGLLFCSPLFHEDLAFIYIHVQLDVYSPIYPCICSSRCVCSPRYIFTYMSTYMFAYIYIYSSPRHIYSFSCIYVFTYTYIYIYIYIAPYCLLGNLNLLFHINLLITHSIIIPFVHSLGSKAWILIYFIIIVVAAALSRPHGPQPTRLLCPWILQGRTLEWVAMLFSRGSPRPTQGSNLRLLHTGGFFTTEPPGKP